MVLEIRSSAMPLNPYRRHLRITGKCVGAHLPDSRSYEPDELRRGWRKCHCPIYACGTLGGAFKRRNTEHWSWDEAKAVASVWESVGSWDGKPEAPVAAAPLPDPTFTRVTIADAIAVFMSLREGEEIATATLRKYRTFTKQIGAFAESRWKTRVRTWAWHGVRIVFSATLLCQGYVHAQSGPQPPCGKEPVPPYPGLDDSANVKSWSKSDFGRDWKAPASTGWAAVGFTALVSTVARFRHVSEADGLLRHIGAISELTGIRYWSATHRHWQTLIVDAYALNGVQALQRRADFTPDEMKGGKVLYFEQIDNLSGKGIYQMHIAEASADRLVFDIENVSTMRYLLMPILRPGEMQAIYYLDRESANVWRYYSIMRTGKNANQVIGGNESSAINRATAFYRHFVGIPTDQEPPAAR
jgi:hypothetical protein